MLNMIINESDTCRIKLLLVKVFLSQENIIGSNLIMMLFVETAQSSCKESQVN